MKNSFQIKLPLMVVCLLFHTLVFCQKTSTKIEGVSKFKIGDTIELLESYGYNFKEITIEPDFDYSEKYQRLENGVNFCNASKVFYCDELKIGDWEFSGGGVLTYYNNRLIDISLLNNMIAADKLTDALKLKYGNTYGKIFLQGYNYNLKKLKAKGVKITTDIDKRLQDLYLSSVYWSDGNNLISVGGSNSLNQYDFFEHQYVDVNLGKSGLTVTDLKGYKSLVACSDRDYKIKVNQYLEKLKAKAKDL